MKSKNGAIYYNHRIRRVNTLIPKNIEVRFILEFVFQTALFKIKKNKVTESHVILKEAVHLR